MVLSEIYTRKYDMSKIIELYAKDRALFVVFTLPLVRLMWGKTNEGEVLFTPVSFYKGYKINNEEHISHCLLISTGFFVALFLVFALIQFDLLPYNSILAGIVAFLILCLVFYIIIRIYLYRIGVQATKVKERLTPISTLDFRGYLRKFV